MEKSRVRVLIVLLFLMVAVLVAEEFATPFVITVHSQGCWNVETIGLFQTINVHGCGNGSWTMVDLFADVRSSGPGTTGAPTILLSQGAVAGGCVGGLDCSNLGAFHVPSPIACSGCAITRDWPNPLEVFTSPGSSSCPSSCYSSTLSSFPFFTTVLLLYLAVALPRGPKIYGEYLKNSRDILGWNSLSDLRKTIITFALGFFIFRTYQFAATIYYLSVHPVPILAFPAEIILSLIVAIWFVGCLNWTIPIKYGPTAYSSAEPRGGLGTSSSIQPISRASSGPGLRRLRPIVLGVLLIAALVVSIVTIPPLYSSIAAALAPRSNLQVTASPSTFSAVPNATSDTVMTVKSLKGPTENVALRVDQTPECNGECTVGLLGVSLSSNSFNLSPGQNATFFFRVDPEVWAGPGSYDFLVTAEPNQGLAASTIVTVDLAGFNLTANPPILSFTQNSFALSTISVTSVYGYAGQIRMFAGMEAQGPVISLSPRNLTLAPGGVTRTILNVTSDAQGNYDIGIDGYSGRLFQTIMLPVTTSSTSSSADFALDINATNPIVNPSKPLTIAIQASSLNGCICIVHLSVMANTSYSGPSKEIITVTPTTSANSTITLETGEYSSPRTIVVTISGSCGPIVHAVKTTVYIQ